MTEKVQLNERLRQLREEYKKGQEMPAQLQAQEADVQQKLLRISGAIQVLEEMLDDALPGEEPMPGAASESPAPAGAEETEPGPLSEAGSGTAPDSEDT